MPRSFPLIVTVILLFSAMSPAFPCIIFDIDHISVVVADNITEAALRHPIVVKAVITDAKKIEKYVSPDGDVVKSFPSSRGGLFEVKISVLQVIKGNAETGEHVAFVFIGNGCSPEAFEHNKEGFVAMNMDKYGALFIVKQLIDRPK